MDNYEFNSKKYIFLIIIVCLMFIIFIIKAFDYLPEKTDINDNDSYNSTEYINEINKPLNRENINEEVKADDSKTDPDRHKSGHIDFFKPKNTEPEKTTLVEIDTPTGVKEDITPQKNNLEYIQTPNSDTAFNSFLKGKNLKKENDYTNALSEFQKAEENADNDELKAMCYENIAEIYAINRKYGTALSFASKAYKLSPSDTREMLIAKIYYQAGQTDKAITRINNALKKSFK